MEYLIKHVTREGRTKQNRHTRCTIVARIRHQGDSPHSLGKRYKKSRQSRRVTGCRRQMIGRR